MKENIIQAIVAKMQRDLDCRQMARLKAVHICQQFMITLHLRNYRLNDVFFHNSDIYVFIYNIRDC